jgi:hypothetical protein
MSRENGAEASLKGFESNLAQNLQHDFAKLFGLFKMVVLSRSGVLERIVSSLVGSYSHPDQDQRDVGLK